MKINNPNIIKGRKILINYLLQTHPSHKTLWELIDEHNEKYNDTAYVEFNIPNSIILFKEE